MKQLLPTYRPGSEITEAVLIAANLVPLVGVLFFGWEITTLLTVYWAETGVIGFYALAKIITSGSDESSTKTGKQSKEFLQWYKILIAGFFCVHFGVFMIVHGAFLLAFFADSTSAAAFNFGGVLLAILGLFISHGVSFYRNYWQAEEYKMISPPQLMGQPYKRVMILHFVILLGAFTTTLIGSFQVAALVLLIVLKTAVDLWAHVREHTSFSSE